MTQTHDDRLALCVSLYRQMKNAAWNKGEIRGVVALNDDSISLLCTLYDEGCLEQFVKIDGKSVKVKSREVNSFIGREAEVTLLPMREAHHSVYFATNLNDLLSNDPFKYKRPSSFYVADIDFFSEDQTVTEVVSNYFDTVRLADLLNQQSDFHEKLPIYHLTLYFLLNRKLQLPIAYQLSDLKPLTGLDRLVESLSTPEHKDQKVNILKSTLIESLCTIQKDDRFAYLLSNFSWISERYFENFRLYASEFSIDKLREEVKEKKLEYTTKINNVFSEIQGKLLAIPVALILIGGQMKQADSLSMNNALVLFGALIFSLFMFILLKNQKLTLRAIKEDLDAQEEKLKRQHPEIAAYLKDAFKFLQNRYNWQVVTIRTIGCIVWLGVILAVVLFVYYTPSLNAFTVSVWTAFKSVFPSQPPVQP